MGFLYIFAYTNPPGETPVIHPLLILDLFLSFLIKAIEATESSETTISPTTTHSTYQDVERKTASNQW